MKPIYIKIKNSKAIPILQSLKDTNLIDFADENENVAIKELLKFKPRNNSKNESFFDLAGIWQNRDINLEQLRNKAWPKRI